MHPPWAHCAYGASGGVAKKHVALWVGAPASSVLPSLDVVEKPLCIVGYLRASQGIVGAWGQMPPIPSVPSHNLLLSPAIDKLAVANRGEKRSYLWHGAYGPVAFAKLQRSDRG